MDAKAYYDIGLSYFGLNVEKKDITAAIKNFETSLTLGYKDAAYFLGHIYHYGHGVTKNFQKALDYYLRGYHSKSYKCGFALGILFVSEYNKAEEAYIYLEASFKGLQEEADHGDVVSMHLMGGHYYLGFYAKRDLTLALDYFEKASALGYAESSYMLGFLYDNPEVGIMDSIKAQTYYELSAKHGHAEALYILGVQKLKDNEFKEAYRYLESAASQNHIDAMFMLASYLEVYEKTNTAERLKWLKMAANQGHVEAMFKLGQGYHIGTFGNVDMDEAVSWYEKAAVHRDKNALYNLAMIELAKNDKDIPRLLDLLESAAKLDHPHAQYNLGIMYQRGEYVKENKIKAFELFKRSANLGFAHAQYNLAVMYYKGDGIPMNKEQGRMWLEKASDQGLDIASQWLLKIIEAENK